MCNFVNTTNSFNQITFNIFMNTFVIFLSVSMLLLISFVTEGFAQNIYDINIPTGSASPDAPYFWQSEKDGSTTGIVEILVGDTIVWKNADTSAHTITSGTTANGPDGLFDSGLFGPGKFFSYTFSEVGDFPYYCVVHPWMEGVIVVTNGYSLIPNVGKNVGDGSTFFDVEYDFNRVLSLSNINVEQKTITFEIIGESKSDNHDLELLLPSSLIDGPYVIWVDGKKITDFELVQENEVNTLFLPLNSDSKILTIVGTSVVPEFGSFVMIIFTISTICIILFSKRSLNFRQKF